MAQHSLSKKFCESAKASEGKKREVFWDPSLAGSDYG